jgi:hypothetical protein
VLNGQIYVNNIEDKSGSFPVLVLSIISLASSVKLTYALSIKTFWVLLVDPEIDFWLFLEQVHVRFQYLTLSEYTRLQIPEHVIRVY